MASLVLAQHLEITTVALTVGYVVLLTKLFLTDLRKTYPIFTSYIAFQLVRPFIVGSAAYGTTAYGFLYFGTQPVLWLLYVLVLLELFQRSLADRRGIAAFSRKFVSVALGVAALGALGSLAINLQRATTQYALLDTFFLIDRVIHTAVFLFLLLLTVFLGYFPVQLHNNARLHTAIFGFYFFARTALLLFRNVFGNDIAAQFNTTQRIIGFVSLVLWTLLLSRAGERDVSKSNWLTKGGQEKRLTEQLAAINAMLLRSPKE